MLLAPLSREAGGLGLCTTSGVSGGGAVFTKRSDPDCAKILAMCAAGKERLEQIKRFDMPGFRPPEPYVREMQRYGILPQDLAGDRPIDTYATDRAYWRSFEQRFSLTHPAYAENPPEK